jgi:hypothetical protein
VHFSREFRVSSAKSQFRFHDSSVTSSREKPRIFGSLAWHFEKLW